MQPNAALSSPPALHPSRPDTAWRGMNGDTGALDVAAFIDRTRFSAFQRWIMALCFLIVAVDGFDTVAVGFVGPALMAQWGVSKLALGPLFGAALVGLAFGALVAGPLGDRIGRKRVLMYSVFFFGLWSLLSASAGSVLELTVLRFLTGLGLGAAMPNAVTLLSEYAPARHHSMSSTSCSAALRWVRRPAASRPPG